MTDELMLLSVVTPISALALGILVAYVTLKIEKRPWPYSWPPASRRAPKGHETRTESLLSPPPAKAPESKTELALDAPQETFLSPRNGNPQPSRWPQGLPKDKLVWEIASNLSMARAPLNGHLIAFRPGELEVENQRLATVLPDLHKELKSACIDMRLANTLVNLSLSPERGKEGLENSYSGLCRRIAEKLERAEVWL